jgi:hypothetical protein
LAALAVPSYPVTAMRIAYSLGTVIAALLLATVAGGAGQPVVRLVQAAPVVIAGTGFKPGGSVTVRYVSGTARLRRAVTANGAGAFRVTFGGIVFARCKGLQLIAGSAALGVPTCSAPNGRPELRGALTGSVSGSAFVPGEHVMVTGRISGATPTSVAAAAVAAANGTFSTRLDLPHLHCAQVFYRAVGALGSQATFTVPAPECMPQ